MFVLEPEGTLLQSLSSSWGRWVGEFTFIPEEVIHRGTSTVEYIAWGAIAPCSVNRPGQRIITYFWGLLTLWCASHPPTHYIIHPCRVYTIVAIYYTRLKNAYKAHIYYQLHHTLPYIGMCTHITRAHKKHDCANKLVSLCDNIEWYDGEAQSTFLLMLIIHKAYKVRLF